MAEYKATLMDDAAVGRALKRIAHEILERNGGADNLCVLGIKRRGVSLAEFPNTGRHSVHCCNE